MTVRMFIVVVMAMLALPMATVNAISTTAATLSSINMENDILHFAYELEQWLDVEAQPCQNFVAYTCRRSWNATKMQLEQRLQQEQQQFDKFLAAANDSKQHDQMMDAELKLKYFYESCQQARSVEELKNSLMYRHSGGWPAVDDASAMIRKRRNITWLGVLSVWHDSGVEQIFQLRIHIKSNKRIVYLEPKTTTRHTLQRFELLADEVMSEFGVELMRSRLVALEILNFERNRREISIPGNDTEIEFTYDAFKAAILKGAMQTEWDAYFRRLFGKPLKSSDIVFVRNLPSLLQIFELLQNTTMTRFLNWIWIDYLMDKRRSDCQDLAEENFPDVYERIVQRLIIDKVQMAQMYAALGRAYDQLLPTTPWIDEMSQQNSQQFLNRILHHTLNGDATIDAAYATLIISNRNFYRNLEKVQRFRMQQLRNEVSPALTRRLSTKSVELTLAANEFMQIFTELGVLLQQQNLSIPLNYFLVGEQFAEHMIAGGGFVGRTPGAWRSTDSEREFSAFKQCIEQQKQNSHLSIPSPIYNVNNLLLKLLARQQLLHALGQWLEEHKDIVKRLDTLLAANKLQLSMRKLYFIGSMLTDCRRFASERQRYYVHASLRNSREFTDAFNCHSDDPLYARNICRVL